MLESVKELHPVYLSRVVLRPASVDIKKRAMTYFVHEFGDKSQKPEDRDVLVTAVTSVMASDYRAWLCNRAPKRGKTVSVVSANSYLNNFRPFWAWLHEYGYIKSNPFASVGPLPVDEAEDRPTYTSGELSRMAKVCEPRSAR